MDIVCATRNAHKLREFQDLLQVAGARLIGLDAYPQCPEVVEDGESFQENALKKARTVAEHTHLLTIADDSGLEVMALQGRPGIHSARFAGPQSDDAANNARLLQELDGLPSDQRAARFRCVIAVVEPGGREVVVEGTCAGTITGAGRGTNGFGYDPLFEETASGRTFAEMTDAEKNRVSHRARATAALSDVLRQFLTSADARGS